MKPVQLYARCSSTNGQETTSQRHALECYARKESLDAEYREDIGTGRSMNRPQLTKIMSGIKDGVVKKLVVWKLSRLGRNVKGVLEALEIAQKHDCEVYSLSEKLDVSTGLGKAFTTLIAVFDALLSDVISENTKAGLEASSTPVELRTGARIRGMRWFTDDKLKKKAAIFTLHRQGLRPTQIRDACSIDLKTVKKMLELPEHLVMSKKETERLAKMVREGRCENPFPKFKERPSKKVNEDVSEEG